MDDEDEYDEHYGGPTDKDLAKERKKETRGRHWDSLQMKGCSSSRFVRIWQKANTLTDAALQLRMARPDALRRANALRKQGVILKQLK